MNFGDSGSYRNFRHFARVLRNWRLFNENRLTRLCMSHRFYFWRILTLPRKLEKLISQERALSLDIVSLQLASYIDTHSFIISTIKVLNKTRPARVEINGLV